MYKTDYGIIGDGLLATHLCHYFTLEGIPFLRWSRKLDNKTPTIKLDGCKYIIILISDDSISNFLDNNYFNNSISVIHFSGSMNSKKAVGFHPLMSFGPKLYTLEEYKNIPFICEESDITFDSVFPTLTNKYYTMNPEMKALYHSLCVISGNFTTLLWQKVMKDFEKDLDLPKEVLLPYLSKIFDNLKDDPFNALTGPIKRGDKNTIKRNKKALKHRIWKNIYSLFNKAYKKELI
ncbi:MAG: DUF2520 domain-containing protein [Spirochaetaceae bacterium]